MWVKGWQLASWPQSGDCMFEPLWKYQKNVRNPNHHYFSKKYRNTPPICIAVRLPFVPQYFWCPYALRKGNYCQYSSHLYRSTPPICIAIRLPFVSQYFWENLGGCGHRNVPQLLVTPKMYSTHISLSGHNFEKQKLQSLQLIFCLD